MRRWAGRHEVALYLVLAFLISWSIWPLGLVNPDSSPLVPFGPGLAAVIVALVAGGRRELIDLLRQLGRWRVSPGWYGVALAVPLGVAAAALGAAMIAGAQAPHWEPSDVLQVVATFSSRLSSSGSSRSWVGEGFFFRDYSGCKPRW